MLQQAASIMLQVRWRPHNKKHLHYDELYQRLLPMLLERPCVEKRDVIEKYLEELCPHWHWECDEIQRDRILWTRMWLAEANAVAIHGGARKLARMRRRSMALDLASAAASAAPLASAAALASEGSVDKLKTSARGGKFKTLIGVKALAGVKAS